MSYGVFPQRPRSEAYERGRQRVRALLGRGQSGGSQSQVPFFFPPGSGTYDTQRQIPSKGSPLGAIGSAVINEGMDTGGEIVGKLLDTFMLGQKHVTRPAAGALAKATVNLPEFWQGTIGRNMSDERKQAIKDADSYTDAYLAMTEGHPVIRGAVDFGADPLNLVGLGAVGKGAQVARMSPRLARAVNTPTALRAIRKADAVDDLLNRTLALPITGPVKLAGAGIKRLPGGVGERITGQVTELADRAQLFKRHTEAKDAIDTALGAGLRIEDLPNIEGSRSGIIRRQIADGYLNATQSGDEASRAYLDVLDDGTLTNLGADVTFKDSLRTADADALRHPSVLKPLVETMKDRGLLLSGNDVSQRAMAHAQLSNVLDNLSMSVDDRTLAHDTVDFLAIALRNSTDEPVDDIYRRFSFQWDGHPETARARYVDFSEMARPTGDEATEAVLGVANPLKRVDKEGNFVGAPEQAVFTFFPQANATTFAHELLGHGFEFLARQSDYQNIAGGRIGRQGSEAAKDINIGEAWAEKLENFLRFADPGDTVPDLHSYMERFRDLSRSFYRHQESISGQSIRRLDSRQAGLLTTRLGSQEFPAGVQPEEVGERAAGYIREGATDRLDELRRRVDPTYQTLPDPSNLRAGERVIVDEAGNLTPEPIGELAPSQIPYRVNRPDAEPFTGVPPQGRSELRQGATAAETLYEVADEVGGASPDVVERIHQLVTPALSKNPDHPPALLWQHPAARKKLQQAMSAVDPTEQQALVDDALAEVNLFWSAVGEQHPILDIWNKVVPDLGIQRHMVPQATRVGGRQALGTPVADDIASKIQEVIDTPYVQEKTSRYAEELPKIADILTRASREHGIKKFDIDTYTMDDLLAAIEVLPKKEAKQVRKFVKEFRIKANRGNAIWKEGSTTIPQLQRQSIIEAHQRWVANELGIPLEQMPSKYQKLFKGFRELALFSLRYHSQNGIDMGFKSATTGTMPRHAKTIQRWADEIWETPIPDGVTISTENEILNPEFMLGRSVFRDLPGGIGRPFAAAFEASWHLARGMENAVRQAAWRSGVARHLTENQSVFREQVRKILSDNRIAPEAGSRINHALDTYGIELSTNQIHRLLTSEGLDARAAQQAAETWGRLLNEGSAAGTNLSNLIHFDYNDVRKIEQTLRLRDWLPFHFWATRNVPYYFQTFAQNPQLLRAWLAFNNASEEERERMGIPSRFKSTSSGLAKWTGVDGFLDMVLGPGTSYFNPMVIMSIADQFKPRYQDPNEPALGRLIGEGSRIGIQPAPWFNIPLTAAGLYGDDAEPFGLIRQSDIIAAASEQLTGHRVDLERPTRAATSALRRVMGKSDPYTLTESGYVDYLVKRNLSEMSIEQTGKPNHPMYVAAMVNPSSPLFQEALERARREEAISAVFGFTQPIPHKRVTDTEMEVIAARKATEDQTYAERKNSPTGRLAQGFDNIYGDARDAQINAGFAMTDLDSRLFGSDQLRQQLPWFDLYLQWLQARPKGSGLDRSPRTFLAEMRGY